MIKINKKRKLSKTEQAELKTDLVNKEKSLANHAKSANINHDRVVENLKGALRHARIAGSALNRAKRIVKSQNELNRKKSVFKKFKTRPWYLKPLTPYQNDVINNELSGYKFTIDEDGKVVQFKPFFSIEELNRKKDKRIVRERIEARRNRRKIKRLNRVR